MGITLATPSGNDSVEMAMLLFKKKFLAAIRSREKTQTIRLWPHRKMKAGQKSYIPGAGYIEILVVDAVDLPGLTDADALPDGFASADALRSEIKHLYVDQLDAGYQAFRLRFRLLTASEAEAHKRSRAKRRAKRV
jgi:hypothetical protein